MAGVKRRKQTTLPRASLIRLQRNCILGYKVQAPNGPINSGSELPLSPFGAKEIHRIAMAP